MKLNDIFLLLIYAVDVNILGGIVGAIKENAETSVVGSKKTGIEVNADKAKNMVMSRDQNAERSYVVKNDNSSFERVEHLKYLGKKKLSDQIQFRKKLTL